jgi:hypothetical protein
MITQEGIPGLTRSKISDKQKSVVDFLPEDLGVEITNHRSPTRYGLSFHPTPEGLGWSLHLKVPRGTSGEKIREILYRHRRWINSRFHKFRQGIIRSQGVCPNGLQEQNSSMILFDGIFHRIIMRQDDSVPCEEKVFVSPEQTIIVSSPKELSINESVLAIRNFFLSGLIEKTIGVLEHRSHQLNLYPKKVVIRNTKRQWGSMNRHGVMSLSLRLAQMPEEILDLVIVHELCHMVHPNHGPSFQSLLSQWTPDHKRKMREISAIPMSPSDSLWESDIPSYRIPDNLLPKPH